MAGHSQFKNIMHRKGAQDAKRAKIFTKIIREITVAVKEGGNDSNSNPRLRSALGSARGANMPKDNIDRAIKKALGNDDGSDYVEIRYEGYGPGGVAIIVDALTENRNRTAADVRSAFNKFGGSLGETNSVSFQFDHLGVISFAAPIASPEVMFEAALEAGADDVESGVEGHEVKASLEAFHSVRERLSQRFGEPLEAKILWEPKNSIAVSEDTARALLKLIDVLEDNDDIQAVYSNIELDEDTVTALNNSL
jgi:YebC/PmpR family DNA-binding regulatory protein